MDTQPLSYHLESYMFPEDSMSPEAKPPQYQDLPKDLDPSTNSKGEITQTYFAVTARYLEAVTHDICAEYLEEDDPDFCQGLMMDLQRFVRGITEAIDHQDRRSLKMAIRDAGRVSGWEIFSESSDFEDAVEFQVILEDKLWSHLDKLVDTDPDQE
jgi:hypothetical protein